MSHIVRSEPVDTNVSDDFIRFACVKKIGHIFLWQLCAHRLAGSASQRYFSGRNHFSNFLGVVCEMKINTQYTSRKICIMDFHRFYCVGIFCVSD